MSPIVQLGQVAGLARDGVAPNLISPGTLFVGLENIKKGGGFEGVKTVDHGELASTKFAFTPKHVLFGKLRPYLAKIALPEFEGVCSTDIIPINPGPKLDRRYLAHYLLTPKMIALASDRATGANLPRLSPKVLLEFPIPLPPLDEQRRIAATLDKAEELRAKRRATLSLLDQLPQAIFLEMFGDPVANSKSWPVLPLSQLGALDRGVSKHRPRNAPELLGGDHPLIQTGDVANSDGYIRAFAATYSDFGLKQSRKWPKGTLCITIAANIAKTGILTFDACFPDSVVGFNAPEAHTTEYVRVWLSFLQKALEDAAPESAQKNINLEILRNLPVPAPPGELRQSFTSRINAVHQAKATHLSALQKLDHLFVSIQSEAFGANTLKDAR